MSAIWAVARNVLLEVFRMKFLMAFLLACILLITKGLALWLHISTGLGDEKVQTFISYSMRFMTGLLSLFTIFLSVATVTRDIAQKEIFTVATKPITRAQFLLGKFTGMALFNLIILTVTCLLIYLWTYFLVWKAPQDDYQRQRVRDLVLVARQSIEPPVPNMRDEARKRAEEIIEERRRSENFNDPAEIERFRLQILPEINNQLVNATRAVAPGRTIDWVFEGIKPDDPQGNVYIRYKHDVSPNPPELKTVGQWAVGPDDPRKVGSMEFMTNESVRTFHEFPVPAELVSPEGRLHVVFFNHPDNYPTTIIFPMEKGIQVLYKAGNFESNFVRAALLVYIRLLFIGVFGLAMGAWLSFPVAVLATLVVYILGVLSGFLLDALQWSASGSYAELLRMVVNAIPKLSHYSPASQIEKGLLVPSRLLSNGLVFLLLLRGGAVGLLGYLIFRFRELARVIV